MKTLLTLLAFACTCTNTLLCADWYWRGEAVLATTAATLAVLSGGGALLIHRLRF